MSLNIQGHNINDSLNISTSHSAKEKQKSDNDKVQDQSRPLTLTQITCLLKLLDPKKQFVLEPKKPKKNSTSLKPNAAAELPKKYPPISYSIQELINFLFDNLPNESLERPAYVTGGAACNILSGLDFNDIDITLNLTDEKYFPLVFKVVKEFIRKKIGDHISDFEISSTYLYKKKLLDNKWAFYGLGQVEIKFVNTSVYSPTYVSSSDSFYIPIFFPKYTVKTGYHNIEEAFTALKNREYDVQNPDQLKFLFFRVIHKLTQGFVIVIDKEKKTSLKSHLKPC